MTDLTFDQVVEKTREALAEFGDGATTFFAVAKPDDHSDIRVRFYTTGVDIYCIAALIHALITLGKQLYPNSPTLIHSFERIKSAVDLEFADVPERKN